MTLNIGSALTGGFRRIANRNGMVLALTYVILGAAWQVAFYSAFVTFLQRADPSLSDVGLPSIEAPLAVAAGVAVLSLVGLQYLTIVAIRTLVEGRARSIPTEYLTRNVVFVVVNTFLGGIAFGLIVFVGSLLLVVPGIIAYVSLIFMMFYLAVEDENFVAALRHSWGLTRGHWLRLFVLLFVLVVGIGLVSSLVSVGTSVVLGAAGGQGLATLASGVIVLPFSLLTLGILADAFQQLRADPEQTTDL